MRIALTGHTRGIGLAIHEHLLAQGHEVTGYSRANGYDLTRAESRAHLLQQLLEQGYNCFINNAYPYRERENMLGFLQTELLNMVWQAWRDQEDKMIITIGSQGADHTKTFFHPYNIHKRAIDETARQLRLAARHPQVVVVRPSWVDTPVVSGIASEKMPASRVAEMVSFVLNSPVRILDITFEK